MTKAKIALLTLIAVLIVAFFALDLERYLSLEFFSSQQTAIQARVQANPVQSALIFFLIYVAVTGLSLPGA
ncbi:MAG TPA: TVP38/TMEM64 family protein, partial [Burkholderiales bacterium]|nr:TVP38/TMEM64 family protein [Burkholderiales bacterium]